MNRIALFILAGIIALTLLLFTCTYQVRFNEVAILTTFSKISGEVTDPGLHFKWPYPIQSVTHYDSRVNVFETRLENVVTKDNQLVIVQLFLTWRIKHPSTFFRVITTETSAQRRLNERMRSAQGVFSEFDFHELVGPADGQGGQRLINVEERIMGLLAGGSDQSQSLVDAYGIEPVAVGISRFILPEKTSTAVFDRMKKTRERLAADMLSTGQAEAQRIVAGAEADAKMIEYFASTRAATIKAKGDFEAAGFAAELGQNEEFAIFLQKLQAIEAIFGTQTKVILRSTDTPFELLESPAQGNGAQESVSDENEGEDQG